MKYNFLNLLIYLFLRKGIWIYLYYNQKTKDFILQGRHKKIFTKKNKSVNKSLMYMGIQHVKDPKSDYFSFIRSNLDKFKPDCVIHELYIRPDSYLKWRESRIQKVLEKPKKLMNLLKKTYGESGYTYYWAKKNQIDSYMIEPTIDQIFDHLLTKFKKEEVFLYHCLVFLSDNNSELRNNPEKINEYFQDHHEDYNQAVQSKTGIKLTLDNFYYYYEKILGSMLDISDKRLSRLCEGRKLSRLITQKVGDEELYFRDREILKKLYWLTQKYNKIAVVYGDSHFLSQHKVIENMYKYLV